MDFTFSPFPYRNEYGSSELVSWQGDRREAHASTPPAEYDFNWSFGAVRGLVSAKLELRPLVPSLHASAFFEGNQDKVLQDMYHVQNLGDVLDYLEWSRTDAAVMMFAIFADPSLLKRPAPSWANFDGNADPTAGQSERTFVFCGVVGLYRAAPEVLSADLGISLWDFARGSGISLRASTLLTQWAMAKSVDGSGLGLRKLRYACAIENTHSRDLGIRLGAKAATSGKSDKPEPPIEWIGYITPESWSPNTDSDA